jgi:hypothetical protein
MEQKYSISILVEKPSGARRAPKNYGNIVIGLKNVFINF